MSVTQIRNVRIIFRRFWLAGLAALAPAAHADGLTNVEQTIFGMDCAPCAYGIEQGLKKLPGVTGVRVSLNEGLAVVALAAENSTTLENIRRVIRDNGFTPKAARVTLVGTLLRADSGVWLEAPGLPRYRLTARDEAVVAALRARPNGEAIRIEGEIPETAAVAGEMRVMRLQSR